MLDLAAFAIGTTEQEGFIDLIFVVSASGGHMHGPVSFWHNPIIIRVSWIIKRKKYSFSGYKCKTQASRKPLQNKALSAKNGLFLVKSTV